MFFYNESDSETSQIGGGSTDEHFDNVSLLLNMDSDFSDSSTYNHTMTLAGDPVISSTQSKFGGASGDFDASGDYLQTPLTADLQFGTGDFTVEFWAYNRGKITNGPAFFSNYQHWNGGGSATGMALIAGHKSLGNTKYLLAISGQLLTFGTVSYNQWDHFAVTRESGAVKVFINGVESLSTTNNGSIDGQGGYWTVGSNDFNVTGYGDYNGFIDDFRVTKGVARYTANFTPPTEAHPTQGAAAPAGATDPSFANVELLLPMDSDLNDVSSNSYVPTVTGGAGISSAKLKFGAASGEFNGGNYATFAATPELAIGTQDFTIEMWINRNGAAGDRFYAFQLGGAQTGALMFGVQYGKVELAIYPSGYTSPTVDTTPGQWHHIAATRESGTLRIFVDGNLVQTGTNNTSIVGADMHVGSGPVWGQYFDAVGGHIDDFRLTIGEARYTANFAPPSQAHPTS